MKERSHALHTACSLYCLEDCSASDDGDYQIKLAGDERRRANTGLSSERIRFHSINIDVLLSPTKWFNSALRPLLQLIHTTVTYTLEGLLFGGKTEE